MSLFFIAQLPPPYGPNYCIANRDEYFTYIYKSPLKPDIFMAYDIYDCITEFSNISVAFDTTFYPNPACLREFGIDPNCLEPVVSINESYPELLI